MKRFLNSLFADSKQQPETASTEYDLRIATAALLIEMANADDEFSEAERAIIIDNLSSRFSLSPEEVEEIIVVAEESIKKQIDIYRFTQRINEHFTKSQKIEIMEMIWRVVYSDKRLDGHEDYLVHRFAKLLRLDHKDMIDAKLRIKQSLNL